MSIIKNKLNNMMCGDKMLECLRKTKTISLVKKSKKKQLNGLMINCKIKNVNVAEITHGM